MEHAQYFKIVFVLSLCLCSIPSSSLSVHQRQPLPWGAEDGAAPAFIVWGCRWASCPWKPQRCRWHGGMRAAQAQKRLFIVETGESGECQSMSSHLVLFKRRIKRVTKSRTSRMISLTLPIKENSETYIFTEWPWLSSLFLYSSTLCHIVVYQ